MSQKWIRSQRWDDQYIPAWAFPVKFVLRALSSIWLAVILLTLVAVYGTLASVPIGLLAKIPTVLLYGLTVVGAVLIGAGLPTFGAAKVLRSAGVGRAGRFAVLFLLLLALTVGSVLAWHQFAWPRLRYNPRTHEGVMLFAGFVDKYSSTTLRRLPGMEMSELEFYSWWPLRVILIAFVVNMVVATLRRIEFVFANIGVLTVHTGIVVIALGSAFYAAQKQEGDMLLRAGPPDERGYITAGTTERGFYDNTDVALWLGKPSDRGFSEFRPIRGLPRYNDYGLNVLDVDDAAAMAEAYDEGRTLDIPVHPAENSKRAAAAAPPLDPDIRFNVVGYATYAQLQQRWVPTNTIPPGILPNPARRVELLSALGEGGQPAATESVVGASRFLPERPAERVRWLEDAVAIEYTRGMSEERWRDLSSRLPRHVAHALVVEIPGDGGGAPLRQVYAASKGARIEVPGSGYTLEVVDLHPRPPFPIITPGYQGAESSVAVVRVTPPATATGDAAVPFTRYVYHRFPEINQDMLDEVNAQGMPTRRDAHPSIRIGYVDASAIQVYLDERPGDGSAGGRGGPVRAIVRLPERDPVVTEAIEPGGTLAIAPMVSLRLGERWPHAASVEIPSIVPEQQRDNEAVGTHRQAAIAVRVSIDGDPSGWSRTVWVPFSLYIGMDPSLVRSVRTPDGREVSIAFGRRRHTLPNFALQLVDFQMFPYPHSDIPQDYRSDLLVLSSWDGELAQQTRPTSLNAPLLIRVPFQERRDVSTLVNALGWLATRIAPNQYKFSQAGWDAQGWRESKALVDAGQLERPCVRFTILGVGNNPGIYIIATGAIMMCAGIPWAFYVKPWLVRRRKQKIKAEIAALAASGAMSKPRRTGGSGGGGSGGGSGGAGDERSREQRPAGATP